MTFYRLAALMVDVDPAQVNTNTLISLGTVVILIGVAWRLSAALTRIDEKLELLDKVPDRLTRVEYRVRVLTNNLEGMDEDLNLLWTTARGEPLNNVRRKSRRVWPEQGEDGGE